jgi:putative Mn2+ efflux pump MntP
VGLIELFLLAIGLSMDAFAVSICKGLGMSRLNLKQAAVIATFFGGFQALMPVIGWALGSQLAPVVEPVDHWIAFALLAFIGGKMIWDAFHEDDEDDAEDADVLYLRELVMLAIATSIDALAVGVTLAFLQVDIAFSVAFIGITTFALSFAGVAIGHQFGSRWEKPSTIAGGIVLILIGLKILLEHLGILAF